MKEKSSANVIQAYMSSILAHKCGSVGILNDNGTEFKNKVLNEVCDQLVLKGHSPAHFIHKVMQKWKMLFIS